MTDLIIRGPDNDEKEQEEKDRRDIEEWLTVAGVIGHDVS